jgi:hypothetical protein
LLVLAAGLLGCWPLTADCLLPLLVGCWLLFDE